MAQRGVEVNIRPTLRISGHKGTPTWDATVILGTEKTVLTSENDIRLGPAIEARSI